jgi:hypothetical protein
LQVIQFLGLLHQLDADSFQFVDDGSKFLRNVLSQHSRAVVRQAGAPLRLFAQIRHINQDPGIGSADVDSMFIRQQRCLPSKQQKYHAHHRLRYRPKVPAD